MANKAPGRPGEERELAGKGLCFVCYRRAERRAEHDPWDKPDKFAQGIKKAQRKGRGALMTIINALEDLEGTGLVSPAIIDQMRAMLKPEVDKIGRSLTAPKMNSERTAESERSHNGDSGTQPTVDRDPQDGIEKTGTIRPPIEVCSEIADLHHRLGGEMLNIGGYGALCVPAWIANDPWFEHFMLLEWRALETVWQKF